MAPTRPGTGAGFAASFEAEGGKMWVRLFERMATNVVQLGTLHTVLPNKKEMTFGTGNVPIVRIHINDWATVRRMAFRPEFALGEAYMTGALTIQDDDLYGLLELAIRNRAHGVAAAWFQIPFRILQSSLRRIAQFNPVAKAQKNVAHHYDLSGELYDLFLDKDRQYSCAYFRSPDDTLEQAQENKKHHIAKKLRLSEGQSVLDIGCGWGGLAITLARDYGVLVVGVTLSKEQHAVATKRVKNAGLQNRVDIRLQDYRHIHETFDRVVSVGMFEHVGVPHYDEYFGQVRQLLSDNGIALIHTIGRSSPPATTNPCITKYIFPGGYCPALSETTRSIEDQQLIAADIEIWRLHYAETLAHWHRRFLRHQHEIQALYDDRFCRMWRFYLVSSELTFRYDSLVVFQFQLSRQVDAVPITRDYLYAAQSGSKLQHAAE